MLFGMVLIYNLSLFVTHVIGIKPKPMEMEDNNKSENPPAYDARDENYQDFYSRFLINVWKNTGWLARGLGVNYETHFSANEVSNFHGKDLGKDIGFVMAVGHSDIDVTDGNEGAKSSQEALATYDEPTEPCDDKHHVDGLFCVKGKGFSNNYYYIPNENNKKGYERLNYLDKTINFYCDSYRCALTNIPGYPYNIEIWVYFGSDPNDFFYIMPFVENYLFNMTGVHLWQIPPSEIEK